MIQLTNIHKRYRIGQQSLHVLKGIDLKIESGEMVAIMGPSGSGKSTLLNVLGLLDHADEGQYRLVDNPMENLSEKKAAYYRNRFLGFVFQSFNLLPFKNAVENVALPLYYQKINRKRRNAMALELLEKLGLKDWAHHRPKQMSGGQNQRVAIARALITDPKIIFADEPTGALDTQTSAEVMGLFKEINRAGKTVVIVTHEAEVAAQAERVIHIRDGQIEKDLRTEARHV